MPDGQIAAKLKSLARRISQSDKSLFKAALLVGRGGTFPRIGVGLAIFLDVGNTASVLFTDKLHAIQTISHRLSEWITQGQ